MIYNCTPHPVNIYEKADVDFTNPRRLFITENAQPVKVIPPCGVALMASIDRKEVGNLEDIPLVTTIYTGVEIPWEAISDATIDDIFIVSALFKTAFNAYHKNCKANLLTIDSAVYNRDGQLIGCLNLCS